jgi:ADP-ribosylation factor-like protein 6
MQTKPQQKPRQLLLCGLDYSGKTTLIKHFMAAGGALNSAQSIYTDDRSDMITTTAFMAVEKITLPFSSDQCIVYDLSGQGRYREQWQYFYPDVDGIFFVVDASDLTRISIVQEVLHEMARHPGLKGRQIPFVILANK